MKTKIFSLAVCLTAAAVLPAHADSAPDFKEFLSGSSRPLTMKFKDLTPRFRRFKMGQQGDTFSNYMQSMVGTKGIETGVYYTTGETVSIGEESYLVAYRSQLPPDLTAIMNHGHGDPVVPVKPGPNTELVLSLLNLRNAGSLNDIRTFDPKLDMQTPTEGAAVSLRTLVILARGVRTAISAHNNVVPKVGAVVTPELRRAFYPHVHDERTWRNPMNDQFYKPNPAISGLKYDRVLNAKYVPAFYEAETAGDGTRGVAFLDGHAERLAAARWERIATTKPKLRQPPTNATVVGIVKAALASSYWMRGSNVQVSLNGSRLVLQGTAPERRYKVRAGLIALGAAPNYTIVNKIVAPGSKGTAVMNRRGSNEDVEIVPPDSKGTVVVTRASSVGDEE